MNETPLARRIRALIQENGPIGLNVFWREAMTAPEHGYYMRGRPIGAAGDFTTAPEISQIFGELIGLWLVDAWRNAGAPAPFALVELGPGRGQLMSDALRAASLDPAFGEAARLFLAEASPAMQAEQRRRLAGVQPEWRPDWQTALAAVDGLPLFLVANEFFDALPIRQFKLTADGWRERRIDASADGFFFAAGPTGLPEGALPEGALPAPLADPPAGSVLEHAPERTALAAAISRHLAKYGGAALAIDYGHGTSRIGDSLQALRSGAPADALEAPGEADITSHVDFQALARAARAANAAAWGPVDQGAFLIALGAEARAAALKRRASAEGVAAIDQALRRLLHPLAMGSLFKAMAFTPTGASAPAGFVMETR